MPTQDIGGGLKMLSIPHPGEKGGPLESAKTVYDLATLAAKLQQAPSELIKSQAEAVKAVHSVRPDVLAAEDAKRLADLVSTQGNENRAKAEFAFKAISGLPAAMAQNFDLTKKIYVKQLINNGVVPPGTEISKNPDGTFAMGIPSADGTVKIVNSDPRRVGTFEQRTAIEKQFSDDYTKATEGFATISEYYRDLKAGIKQNSAPGDFASMYGYIKMLDKNTRVQEGQIIAAGEVPNLPESMRNAWNRAVTDGGPIWGPPGSQTRKDFERSADVLYDSSAKDALLQAKHFGDITEASGGNSQNVVHPFGGIEYDPKTGIASIKDRPLKLGEKAAVPKPDGTEPRNATVSTPDNAPRTPPVEASVTPATQSTQPAAAAAPAGPQNVEDTLRNMFQLPEAR